MSSLINARVLWKASNEFYCMSLYWQKGLSSCIRVTLYVASFITKTKMSLYKNVPDSWLKQNITSVSFITHVYLQDLFCEADNTQSAYNINPLMPGGTKKVTHTFCYHQALKDEPHFDETVEAYRRGSTCKLFMVFFKSLDETFFFTNLIFRNNVNSNWTFLKIVLCDSRNFGFNSTMYDMECIQLSKDQT